MRLSIIAAVSSNQVIGNRQALPWNLPADRKRFQKLTMGHHLLMGRKTFESIGFVLPGRTTLVITHQPDYHPEGVRVAHSLEEALRLVKDDSELFIAGGTEIYRQMLPLADRLYITYVHEDFEGDTRFPDFDPTGWELISQEDREPDQDNAYSYSFVVYDRTPNTIA
jgi:dihydrofolate reductase